MATLAPERPRPGTLRVVAWHIHAGGGSERIAEALLAMHADVLVLSNFGSGVASTEIEGYLARAGFRYRVTSRERTSTGARGLLIAALVPMRRVGLHHRPDEPGGWLMVRLKRPRLALGAMSAPHLHSDGTAAYQRAVLDIASRWRGGPALLIGNTNSGRIGEDEQTPVFDRATHTWFDDLRGAGWFDGFRLKHGGRREFTWYSPERGHGLRLDQVFLEGGSATTLLDVRHHWAFDPGRGERRDALSDHAALIVDLDARRLTSGAVASARVDDPVARGDGRSVARPGRRAGDLFATDDRADDG